MAAEALARWNDPERGLVPPDEFIPLAEETGLIVSLGHHLVRRAWRDYARWRKEKINAAVAEGIETEEQLRRLRALGCDYGQGFLFCAPVPPDRLTDWLEEGRTWPVGS